MFALPIPRSPVRAAKLREEEIERLRAALPVAEVDDRADVLFRLGEVEDEQRESAEPGSPARAEAAAAAVSAWRALFEDPRHRDHARRDRALFDTAYLLHEEQRPAEAQPLFQRLIDEHPRSPLVPNAEVARAESFFEGGDLVHARTHYEAVLAHRESPLWVYAQYKLGWVHHNLGEREAALHAFEQIVALADEGKVTTDEPTLAVIAQSRKDLLALRAKK